MAVISTEQRVFMGELYKHQVRVLRDGRFRIKYPKCVQDALQIEEAVAETQSAALSKFNKTLADFSNSNTSTRRLILYNIETSISFAQGVSIGVSAGVFDEHKTDLPGKYTSYRYKAVHAADNLPYGLRKGTTLTPHGNRQCAPDRCLEWTPERHAFFEKIHDAMTNLQNRLKELGDNQETLLAIIDSGQKLLES